MRSWLQLFRAQTAPATLLLILVPYLQNAPFLDLKTLVLAVSAVLFHYFSFGENSLMDTAMRYDLQDPSKKHHPLISGRIGIHEAHNVIHWGLAVLTVWAVLLTFWLSPNPTVAMAALILWVAFGHAYNEGLSKESSFGFLAISICSTASGAWGWFLSHESLTNLGILYLGYVFFTILFQISWSGFVKEMEIRERSNILTRMGASLEQEFLGEKIFKPGKAKYYGYLIKGSNLFLGSLLLWSVTQSVSMVTLVLRVAFFVIFAELASFYLYKLTKERVYDRGRELLTMSLEEIATIYLPIPLLLGLLEASVLMATGVLYFFSINLLLWGKPYPRV